MKLNKAHMYVAIIQSILEFSSMERLANEVEDKLNKDTFSVEIMDIKAHGFSLRRKKDTDISTTMISDAIAEATQTIIEDHYDDAMDYVADKYEFVLDTDYINESYVENVFDISKSGRIIYIEVDS